MADRDIENLIDWLERTEPDLEPDPPVCISMHARADAEQGTEQGKRPGQRG